MAQDTKMELEKSLAPKQAKVYTLLTQGKTPDEIAKRMKISVNGVYGHMRRIEEHGIDLSKYRRSSNGSRANGTRRGRRRRTSSRNRNGYTPGVKDFLKTLDMSEANLQREEAELSATIHNAQETLTDAQKRGVEVENALLGIKDARSRVSNPK